MPKRRHVRIPHPHSKNTQEGFISNEQKKSMNKNEKIIMGILVAGIIVFLALSIIVLFGKTNQLTGRNGVTAVPTVPTNMVTHKAYPTIAPIENTTVMVNSRRFNPASVTIPRGGYVQFINIDSDPMIIEGNDNNSSMLNVGSIATGETKNVTFSAPGTYTYKNAAIPAMTGIIIIR